MVKEYYFFEQIFNKINIKKKRVFQTLNLTNLKKKWPHLSIVP